MLSIDELCHIYLTLGSQNRLLYKELLDIYSHPTYQAWYHNKEQYFTICKIQSSSQWIIAESLGLIQNGQLQVRINKIGEKIFLTDGLWQRGRLNVFPFSEESESLLEGLYKNGFQRWADTIVDMSAGCGHSPLGINAEVERYIFDVNPRALAYCHLNSCINGFAAAKLSVALHNLKHELPLVLRNIKGKKVLFLFNTPFVPNPSNSPQGHTMALNADGGRTGTDLQIRSFEVVAEFAKLFPEKEVKACFLTWSFGRAQDQYWELQDKCNEILKCATSWTFTTSPPNEPSNCCSIQEIFNFLQNSVYVLNESPFLSKDFQQLAEEQLTKGLTHLGYGVVTAEL